jgi:Ca2+-binding EF-hand superfamily protein
MQPVHRWILGLAAVLSAFGFPVDTASAFTDEEVAAIFQMLDTDHDGKITRDEYLENEVKMIYRNIPMAGAPNLTFEQTRLSRAFFDAADTDHDGTLDPVEITDALPFEAADPDHKGYILYEDLRRFLGRIGR